MIQCVSFYKTNWTLDKAYAWLYNNHLNWSNFNDSDKYFTFLQMDSNYLIQHGFIHVKRQHVGGIEITYFNNVAFS
jgi:hypothetical protein